MTPNYKIFRLKSGPSLHVNLRGEFSNECAAELIILLNKNREGCQKVFVHTEDLLSVDPQGRQTFHSGIRSSGVKPRDMTFTGKQAKEIAPKGAKSI